MKTFFKKIALFFLLSFSVFFLLKFSLRKYQQKNYNSVFIDKLKMLRENKGGKRIILFGGSSVGWGFSAEQIEKKLGIKTINLGLSMGLGLTDFQSFLTQNLTKEDIVVFSPEWIFYTQPDYYDTATLENLFRYNYEYGKLINNDKYVFQSYLSKIQLGILQSENKSTPYVYNCFNKNGDIISQCSLPAPGPRNYGLKTTPLKINVFPKYFPFLLTNKTIFAFPPTQDRIYNEYKSHFNNIQQSLLNQHYTLVDSVINNVYPLSDFFDAEYHVKCDVRTRRTEKLISFLQQVIK
jgi:hypothetical protein